MKNSNNITINYIPGKNIPESEYSTKNAPGVEVLQFINGVKKCDE